MKKNIEIKSKVDYREATLMDKGSAFCSVSFYPGNEGEELARLFKKFRDVALFLDDDVALTKQHIFAEIVQKIEAEIEKLNKSMQKIEGEKVSRFLTKGARKDLATIKKFKSVYEKDLKKVRKQWKEISNTGTVRTLAQSVHDNHTILAALGFEKTRVSKDNNSQIHEEFTCRGEIEALKSNAQKLVVKVVDGKTKLLTEFCEKNELVKKYGQNKPASEYFVRDYDGTGIASKGQPKTIIGTSSDADEME